MYQNSDAQCVAATSMLTLTVSGSSFPENLLNAKIIL